MSTTVLSLPTLSVKGTHFQVGHAIGRTFRQRISDFCREFEDLDKKFIPFYKTQQGKNIVDGYLTAATRHFPQYVEELQGISKGSEIPFFVLFLLQINMELRHVLKGAQYECSTLHLTGNGEHLIAHNEDTHPLVKTYGYVVRAIIEDEVERSGKLQKTKESFTAYCYPASLPGRAMGFNDHGMVVTVNALYPKNIALGKTPRVFLNRALLAAESLEDVQAILADEGQGTATGFSANIGVFKGYRSLWNFEAAPPLPGETTSRVTEHRVVSNSNQNLVHFYHFNNYCHSPDVAEDTSTSGSSIHRREAADSFAAPTSKTDLLRILGDDSDTALPIYRTPRPTDPGETVATGVFDMIAGTWEIYLDNPTTSTGPILVYKLF